MPMETATQSLLFKLKRWESLLHMGRRIIVVGDLNIAPSAIDRCDAGPEFDNNEFRRWFRSILTQYKRAKPESILSAHRWKGGRSIKLEGSDHAPVFMTLVDIPDVSLHRTPSLSSRYVPMVYGLQQTIFLTKDKFLRASKNQSRSVTKAPTMKGIHTTEDRRGIGG
nr:DNA-(apurinic or apyrimidinic site) lyase 2 [Arachis hypogaea]